MSLGYVSNILLPLPDLKDSEDNQMLLNHHPNIYEKMSRYIYILANFMNFCVCNLSLRFNRQNYIRFSVYVGIHKSYMFEQL